MNSKYFVWDQLTVTVSLQLEPTNSIPTILSSGHFRRESMNLMTPVHRTITNLDLDDGLNPEPQGLGICRLVYLDDIRVIAIAKNRVGPVVMGTTVTGKGSIYFHGLIIVGCEVSPEEQLPLAWV